MRGLFVTGTGTGVGKTVLSAALIAAIVAAGESVRAHKPVLTGLDESGDWPADHELLAAAANMSPEEVAPLRYRVAAAPHLAAELAGEPIDPAQLLAVARAAAHAPSAPSQAAPHQESLVIVEGVGGLLVPLTEEYTVLDFAVALGLPLVVAAPPGLGTINHTLLTLLAARAAGLHVLAVVLTPWPESPSTIERSNRQTISRLGAVEVRGLPCLSAPNPMLLAQAGARLPWRRWLSCPAPQA